MIARWRMFALAALLAVPVLVPAQDIRESEVRAVLAGIDRATARRDVAALGRLVADDVRVSGTFTTVAGTESFDYDKQQYLEGLRWAWSQAVDFRAERSNERIVTDGSSATVSADVVETMVLPAATMRTRSRTTMTFERVSGAVLLTRAVAHGTM